MNRRNILWSAISAAGAIFTASQARAATAPATDVALAKPSVMPPPPAPTVEATTAKVEPPPPPVPPVVILPAPVNLSVRPETPRELPVGSSDAKEPVAPA